MLHTGPWYVVGPLIGLVIVGFLFTTNKPLGALGGYIDLVDWLRRPTAAPGWRAFFLLGLVGGGAAYAWLAGAAAPAVLAHASFARLWGDAPAKMALVFTTAGVLMGFGARTGGGCTSGHGLCGTSLGSPSSFVATATFMATAVIASHAVNALLAGSP